MANSIYDTDFPSSSDVVNQSVYSWREFANDLSKFDGSIDDFLVEVSKQPLSAAKGQFLTQIGLQRKLTEDDRAYNDPSAQVARLVAAGMSRSQALAMVSGGSAAVPAEVPTPGMTPEAQGALQGVQTAAQVASTAIDFASAIPTIKAQRITNESLPDMLRANVDLLHEQGNSLNYANQIAKMNVDAINGVSEFMTAWNNYTMTNPDFVEPDNVNDLVNHAMTASTYPGTIGAAADQLEEVAQRVGPLVASNPVAYQLMQQNYSRKYLESSYNRAFLHENLVRPALADIEPYRAELELQQLNAEIANLNKQGALSDAQRWYYSAITRGALQDVNLKVAQTSQIESATKAQDLQNEYMSTYYYPNMGLELALQGRFIASLPANAASTMANAFMSEQQNRNAVAHLNYLKCMAGEDFSTNYPTLFRLSNGLEYGGFFNAADRVTGLWLKGSSARYLRHKTGNEDLNTILGAPSKIIGLGSGEGAASVVPGTMTTMYPAFE